jgi:hypothetical protein
LVDLVDSDIRQLGCGNDQLDVKSNAHGGWSNNFIPSSASTAAIKIQIKLRIRIKFAKKIKIHAIPIIYLK